MSIILLHRVYYYDVIAKQCRDAASNKSQAAVVNSMAVGLTWHAPEVLGFSNCVFDMAKISNLPWHGHAEYC